MLVCEVCKQDVYMQQRKSESYGAINEPYYCWYCEEFKNYDEVETKK